MIYLCQSFSKGEKQISKNDASKTVAFEIRNDWMSKNVYPLTERAVAKKIRDDYETLMALVRYECASHKKDDTWTEKAKNFNGAMCAHQSRSTPTSGPPQSKRKSPCAQVISL